MKRCALDRLLFVLIILVFSINAEKLFSQPDVMAWGNITALRLEGHPVQLETSLCLIGASLMDIEQTGKEKQSPRYRLEKDSQTVTTSLSDIEFTEVVRDNGNGGAIVTVDATATADTSISGAFFCIELSEKDFPHAEIELVDSSATTTDQIPLRRWRRFSRTTQVLASRVRINSENFKLDVNVNEPTNIVVQSGSRFAGSANTRIYFAILPGAVTSGQTGKRTFSLSVSGNVDKTPVTMILDATKPGRIFDGIGGNFRLQNPQTDPQVIDYCLENLNVTWGRVEMPWSSWHPVESENPLEAARAGQIPQNVHEAMKMARRLSKMGMPVIVSAWSAPRWALEGEVTFRRQNGVFGNPLNQSKMQSIIKSLTSYLLYLKEAYGVEAAMFSFNESDLGINVRQTGEEHAELIKRLGASMASQRLATKMLLGDNSDATTYSFLEPAMRDPETHKYIGAMSFHSWRGCDDWTLSIWADMAREMNVPLLVGEGSTDAAAHRYPDIFLQPAFSLAEIDTYVRIANICQARSILQWQLTADYSVLTGNGIFNTTGELRPTQRFWNLRQFGLASSGSFHLPIHCDGQNISCAAFGDIGSGVYTLHIVNNGAARKVRLTGLPNTVKQVRVYHTDATRNMQEGKNINVTNGTAQFMLDSMCFTSLISLHKKRRRPDGPKSC